MADATPSVQVVSSSAPSTSQQPPATGMGFRQCLLVSTAALLTEVGFDSCRKVALESLAELLQSFIVELGRSSRAFTELACRTEPLGADVLLALTEMGYPSGYNLVNTATLSSAFQFPPQIEHEQLKEAWSHLSKQMPELDCFLSHLLCCPSVTHSCHISAVTFSIPGDLPERICHENQSKDPRSSPGRSSVEAGHHPAHRRPEKASHGRNIRRRCSRSSGTFSGIPGQPQLHPVAV